MSPRLWALTTALTTALACGADATPAKAHARLQPANQHQAVSEPAAEPAAAAERCKVTVEGGDDLLHAMVNTKSGLRRAEVIGGHELTFKCPPVTERSHADIVGARSVSDIVHWSNVDLDQGGRLYARVKMSDSKDGLPPHWSDQEKQQYRIENSHLDWDELDAGSGEDETPRDAPPAKKFPVTFVAYDLDWAELEISGPGWGRSRPFELNPTDKTRLPAGNYGVEVRREQGGGLVQAKGFEIDGEHERYTVKIMDDPLRAHVEPN